MRPTLLFAVAFAAACHPSSVPTPLPSQQAQFWSSLSSLCGQAFRGTVTESVPPDTVMSRASLVMHVRQCSRDTLRIPFHVGPNRSRTWVITREPGGLRLKHDHRHEDGSEDSVTQYGGDTKNVGTPGLQEFYADAHTATVVPAARTNVWMIEIIPGQRFAYGLRREGSDRRFRVDFDLAKPISPPPAPWGAK